MVFVWNIVYSRYIVPNKLKHGYIYIEEEQNNLLKRLIRLGLSDRYKIHAYESKQKIWL